MSLDKQSDLREVLEAMGQEYGVTFTPEETKNSCWRLPLVCR